MASALQIYFIEPASLQMEGILYLHEHIFGLLCGILTTVLVLYRRVIVRALGWKEDARSLLNISDSYANGVLFFFAAEQRVFGREINANTKKFLEIFWTVVPA